MLCKWYYMSYKSIPWHACRTSLPSISHIYARRIAHTPFKYPGSGGGSLCARWVGTHQHPAIPNFDSEIERRPIDF